MHGVFIQKGLSDWQIIQHTNGFATVHFEGIWNVPTAAIDFGTKEAFPMIRVMSESDNEQIVPWTRTKKEEVDTYHGTWSFDLTLPAGGLYRVETGLDTKSIKKDFGWIFRGDVRLHIGVGDLFVIAGQSNSSGYGRDSAQDLPDINVHLYRNRHQWDLACHPMNESTYSSDEPNAEMGVSGVSPYLSFGKTFHRYSHYPVGLIQTAKGGQPINMWDTRKDGSLYYNLLTRINECGGNVTGILWYQGCSDASKENATNYLDSFQYFVQSLRADLSYEVPFFTLQLNREIPGSNDHYWGIIRESQRIAAETIKKVSLLTTINCSLSDGIHNSAHSSLLIGEKLAKQCAGYLYGTSKFEPPFVTSITRTNSIISIKLSNVIRSLLVVNDDPRKSGFLLEDEDGEVPITQLFANKEVGNELCFTFSKVLTKNAKLSFAWESNPTTVPPVDEVTYLPVVSFYQLPVPYEKH